ncbi:MAG: M3 family oligoendopeptidase [Spirochaetales bacterium]|nr:M3 family oligoendopeptidase [Spirochaetales bacterium]
MDAPRWNLESIYPEFLGAKYKTDTERLSSAIRELSETVGSHTRRTDTLGWVAGCIQGYNKAADLYGNLASYVYAVFSTDTQNATVAKELNRLEEAALPLKRALVSFRNNLAEVAVTVKEKDFQEKLAGILGESYDYFLAEQLKLQEKQMSPEEEDLAEDLARSGGNAWTRLQESVSSTLTAVWDGETGERKTVVQLRALAFDPDRQVREKAYSLELEAWKRMEIPLSYSLNGVKGFAVTFNKRRHFNDDLESALFASRISRKTLDALLGAMEEGLPVFRRYLKAKARYLGVERLRFYDLFAPVGESTKQWTFAETRAYIEKQFGEFSSAMGRFAKHAFDGGWIDAESRAGKVGGAYCTGFPLAKESRILCNFEGSFSDLMTIAHELGHAYHGHVLKDNSAIHSNYPMTLAETASIFAQTLVFDASLAQAPANEKIHVIEDFLQDSTQVIVDILSRFYFERDVFAGRAAAEISPGEMCQLMIEAQKATYGEALDENFLHGYMWAAKPHYYSHELGFYNYPYAFGLLFGLGLYSRYKAEGEAFVPQYDKVLKMTGRASANEVTAQAGFDIENRDFWMSGISQVANYVDEFERLVDA